MKDVTCILTLFRRPDYLVEQVKAVQAQTIKPAAMWLYHNTWYNHKIPAEVTDAFDQIVTATPNMGVWPRFLLGMEATTPDICVFDDDTVPGTRWLENCQRCIRKAPGVMGTIGLIFPSGTGPARHRVGWATQNKRLTEVDIVGHSWYFKREWLRAYAAEPRHGGPTFGEDYHMSVALQRQLGLGTYVPPHPPDNHDLWGSTHGHRYGADSVALYKQPHEQKRKANARARYIRAGWRTLSMRKAKPH